MVKTVFLTITAAEQESVIARAIVAREREIFAYENNIDNYEKAIAAGGLTPAFQKRLGELLISENAERDKAVALYNTLKTQIAPANIAAALVTAKAILPAM